MVLPPEVGLVILPGSRHLAMSRRADTDQPDVLVADELRNLAFVHWSGIAINQQDFMCGRCQSLKQKHPEVGHEVAGDAVVRVVKQNSHDTPLKHSLARLSPPRSWKTGILDVSGGFPSPDITS